MRKAQIQTFETIAVLMVFFILIGIGFIFYTKIFKSNIEVEKEETSQIKSVNIAQKAIFLPEIQCAEDNIAKDNCIDKLKLNAASLIMQKDKKYYFDVFEFSEITVTQIYPDLQKWTLYSMKTDNYKSNFITNVPVALYDPVKNDYSFGILTIDTQTQ